MRGQRVDPREIRLNRPRVDKIIIGEERNSKSEEVWLTRATHTGIYISACIHHLQLPMAPRVTLAEKFAQKKSNGSELSGYITSLRQSPRPRKFTATYSSGKVPGSYSPIRHVRLSARIPATAYKALHGLPSQNRVRKPRRAKDGWLSQLRRAWGHISARDTDEEFTALRASAAGVAGRDGAVDYDLLFLPRTKEGGEHEVDEVEETLSAKALQRAQTQRQAQLLNEEAARLQLQLRESQEAVDRKLYLADQNTSARIHALEEQVRLLEARPSNGSFVQPGSADKSQLREQMAAQHSRLVLRMEKLEADVLEAKAENHVLRHLLERRDRREEETEAKVTGPIDEAARAEELRAATSEFLESDYRNIEQQTRANETQINQLRDQARHKLARAETPAQRNIYEAICASAATKHDIRSHMDVYMAKVNEYDRVLALLETAIAQGGLTKDDTDMLEALGRSLHEVTKKLNEKLDKDGTAYRNIAVEDSWTAETFDGALELQQREHALSAQARLLAQQKQTIELLKHFSRISNRQRAIYNS